MLSKLILDIIERLTKRIYFKLIKVMINVSGLAELIMNIVVRHYRVLELIVTD